MKDFRKLNVWQKSHELVLDVYRATALFPGTEIYGLTSQIRRAGVSIPANVAEGCGRGGDPEFGRFLQISMGSASELEYHFLLARELGYLTDTDYSSLDAQVREIKQMLTSLIQKVKISSDSGVLARRNLVAES